MNKEEKGASITIQASGFPLSAFKEWDESCKKDFGDCRWVKIMHDHKMANNNQMVNLLLDRIERLEHQLALLTSTDTQQIEPGVRTLGGELK
jgi:hypothetical protein